MAITGYVDFVNNYLTKNGQIGNAANINKAPGQLKLEVDELNQSIGTLGSTAVKLTGNETISGVKTFSSNIVGNVTGNITGNAGTATKLATARTINGVAFDGSANITVGDSTAVKLTGDQTVSGVKTFSSSLIVPTPTAGTQAANKQYVDSKYSGFKNYIINGKKVVNQRELASTDNSYNQDRWYKAGNNWFQGIEGGINLISGKTYTLSWVGSASAGYYVGNATSSTINSQIFTPIANGGSFTLTISPGQNLWIKFISDATGSTFNFVQLEEGSVDTPFEQRPGGLELSLCQRYYQISQVNNTFYGPAGMGWQMSVPHKIEMRVVPTCTVITPTGQLNIGTLISIGTNTRATILAGIVTTTGVANEATEFKLSAEL